MVNIVWNFNIAQTYLDKYYPWFGNMAAAAYIVIPKTIRLKVYSLIQLLFIRDMTLLIKHKVDWESIHPKKQTQINKDNIRKNIKRVEPDYRVRDKVMLNNNAAYK